MATKTIFCKLCPNYYTYRYHRYTNHVNWLAYSGWLRLDEWQGVYRLGICPKHY